MMRKKVVVSFTIVGIAATSWLPCLQFIADEPQVVLGSKKSFTFDHAFNEDVSQEDVFNKCVLPMIDSVFKGYNVTVMAYGQTGSGKTHTMGTVFSATTVNDQEKLGIIPRAIKAIFEGMTNRKRHEFQIKASFLEIYKEEVNDLLKYSKSGSREEIIIRDDANGVKLVGIAEVPITNYDEVLSCLERGSLMRTTGNTAMNSHSSRSHAIFTLCIEMKNLDSGANVFSKFHFVDLAGSERAKKTKAEGERFKEGVNINLGLLALGNVICALCEGNARNHIPYRESKLTRLLQDSLGGSSHTIMIACVGPADYNMEETLNTLRYASRARKIKNKPIVNQNPQTVEIARLRLLVQQLQSQLIVIPNGNDENPTPISVEELKAAQERIMYLESENEHLGRELQNAIEHTTELYEKAFTAENACDKFKQKLDEMKQKTGLAIDSFNESISTTENPKLKEHLEQIKELQKTLVDLQEVQDDTRFLKGNTTSMLNVTFDVTGSPHIDESCASPNDVNAAKRQAELNRQLQSLNKALAMKEELAAKLLTNGDHLKPIKEQYEHNLRELEKEVSELQHEKEELSQALRAAQTNTNNKISEQRRKRLLELESQLTELKKKMVEYQRLASMKTQSDKEINKLNKEITDMKHQRVQLVRQMKQESEQMRKYKLDKEREVNHLKQQDQKHRIQLVRKQQQFEREQNVSKRRIEQVAAVNKRLKEALMKQKSNADRREKDKDKAGKEKTRNLIDQEVELAMSIWEAKYHLELLVKDRKELTEEIENLRNDISDTSSDSSSNETSIMSPSKKLAKVNKLEMELEMKQIQIDEIQQKLLDADQEERKKIRWMGIQLMSDAKTGLNYLFHLVATSKQELYSLQANNQELMKNEEEYRKHIKEFKQEICQLKYTHEENIVQLKKHYEDQMYCLMMAKEKVAEQSRSLSSTSTSMITAPEECPPVNELAFTRPALKFKPPLARPKKHRYPSNEEEHERIMSDEEVDDDKKNDPDWTDTPLMRRIQQMRRDTILKQNVIDLDDLNDEVENEEPSFPKKRRSNKNSCRCLSGCNKKRCQCFKGDRRCSDACKCNDICTNRI